MTWVKMVYPTKVTNLSWTDTQMDRQLNSHGQGNLYYKNEIIYVVFVFTPITVLFIQLLQGGQKVGEKNSEFSRLFQGHKLTFP